jgi:hypothetical protein
MTYPGTIVDKSNKDKNSPLHAGNITSTITYVLQSENNLSFMWTAMKFDQLLA